MVTHTSAMVLLYTMTEHTNGAVHTKKLQSAYLSKMGQLTTL